MTDHGEWVYVGAEDAPPLKNGWVTGKDLQGTGQYGHKSETIFTLPPGYRPNRSSRYYLYRHNGVPRWKRFLLELRIFFGA